MLPSWQKIWEGEDSQVLAKDVEALANPTNGKVKKK